MNTRLVFLAVAIFTSWVTAGNLTVNGDNWVWRDEFNHHPSDQELQGSYKQAVRELDGWFGKDQWFVELGGDFSLSGPYDGRWLYYLYRGSGGSGDCFVATRVFGGPWASQINTLRHFRDHELQMIPGGSSFIRAYYGGMGRWLAKNLPDWTIPPIRWMLQGLCVWL